MSDREENPLLKGVFFAFRGARMPVPENHTGGTPQRGVHIYLRHALATAVHRVGAAIELRPRSCCRILSAIFGN